MIRAEASYYESACELYFLPLLTYNPVALSDWTSTLSCHVTLLLGSSLELILGAVLLEDLLWVPSVLHSPITPCACIYDCVYVSLNALCDSVVKYWKLATIPKSSSLVDTGHLSDHLIGFIFLPAFSPPSQWQHHYQRDRLQTQNGFIALSFLERALKEDMNQHW